MSWPAITAYLSSHGLELAGIGSSGQDGVSIDLGKSASAKVTTLGALGPSAPVGAFVSHTVTGQAGGR